MKEDGQGDCDRASHRRCLAVEGAVVKASGQGWHIRPERPSRSFCTDGTFCSFEGIFLTIW